MASSVSNPERHVDVMPILCPKTPKLCHYYSQVSSLSLLICFSDEFLLLTSPGELA